MKAFRYLLVKEFKLFFRNAFFPKMSLMMPLMVMLVLPWCTTMDCRNIRLCVVDSDHSMLSQRLVHKLEASSYFILQGTANDYGQALSQLEAGDVDVILEVPYQWEKSLSLQRPTQLHVLANSVNSIKGSMGINYMGHIISDFSDEVASERGMASPLPLLLPENLYNPTLDYRFFMLPSLLTMILILLCGLLPALNIVTEKETGTIEQMNVTPVNRLAFIMSKLLPYWVVGTVALTLSILIMGLVYGLWPQGGFTSIYIAAALIILSMSGIGLTISNYSATMSQAMFTMYFVIMICMLMSGLFTPVASMPQWAKYIAACIPPHYFIDIMRSVYLKGSSLIQLWQPFACLVALSVLLNMMAGYTYHKQA
jgi:ABC-2 type transport system permease protein